jgi:phage-related protein
VLRDFPKPIKKELGEDIQRMQLGEKPRDSRPMKSIGQGVFELKQVDDKGWYRVIYLSKIANRIFMLHSFIKKSSKTSQRDLNTAKNRLIHVRAKLAKEKRNAKNPK